MLQLRLLRNGHTGQHFANVLLFECGAWEFILVYTPITSLHAN